MKRDMELIRKLAFQIENSERWSISSSSAVEGFGQDDIAYNLQLMAEHGLIDADTSARTRGDPYRICAERLTWEGHDFVDAVRNDAVWAKIMARSKQVGTDLSIEGAKFVARQTGQQIFTHGVEWLKNTDWSWITQWPM